MSDPLSAFTFAMVSALIVIIGAMALGYLLGKGMGAITLFVISVAAAYFCLFGALLAGWPGLIIAMILVAGMGALLGRSLSGQRGALVVSLMWIGWCVLGIFGYQMAYQPAYHLIVDQDKDHVISQAAYDAAYLQAYNRTYLRTRKDVVRVAGIAAGEKAGEVAGEKAGKVAGEKARKAAEDALRQAGREAGRQAGPYGFVLIALPNVALFWVGAYALSQKLLPFGDRVSRAYRLQAFRALLTYTLGTNGAYYVVENRKPTKRVSGDQSRRFLAGPGIVITGCDHTVVISDGIKIKGVQDPGVSFTKGFERVEEAIDLRVQVRVFDVEALTKDGLRIKVRISVPFRIQAGSQWPELNTSFPFRKSAVFNAVRRQPVEHSHETLQGKTVEIRQRRSWDEVVSIAATQVIRRIISTYSFDELCAPYELQRDPRKEIVDKLQRQVKEELEPVGIQVIGGGVSNLLPVDNRLLQQRMDNWQAEWTRRTAIEMGKADAEYIRMIESARAQAQAEMIRTISEGLERAGAVDTTISNEVIALRFVEALEKMIASPAVQRALPASTVQAVETIKHSIEGRPH
jgi:SPFH domain / Band 7 family